MTKTPLPQILQTLGYTQAWLDIGVVDEPFLREQFERYLSSEDQNGEHYRHRAFTEYLRRKTRFLDEEIGPILALRDHGHAGASLAVQRANQLLGLEVLTDRQYLNLATHPALQDPSTQRLYLRGRILRRLRSEGLTASVFTEVMACADASEHRTVLAREDLHREHADWLASNGANVRIRNIARQIQGSRRFR